MNNGQERQPWFGKLFVVNISFLIAISWPLFSGIPQELNRVTLVNETGLELTRFYWSPTYQGTREPVWGPNVLTLKKSLAYGQALSFYIHYPDTCGLFDFLAFDSQGNGYSMRSFQVCNREEGLILLEPRHRVSAELLPKFEEISVEFINDSPIEIWFLFLSPQSFSLWGFDVLSDGSVLGPGDRVEIIVPYKVGDQKGQLYDLLAVDGRDQLFNDRFEFSVGSTVALRLSNLIRR
ncbi:MAG: hypothetical protein GW949_07915 [Spirochaetales bacterium]|nr:hypothetical protein [Spirochaetales bacterium]